MRFEGYLEKPGGDKLWGVEIPCLDLRTQGKSKVHAYRMAKSVVEDILGISGYSINVEKVGDLGFNIVSDNPAPLLALMIRRQRTAHGLTVREAAARAGFKSPSVFSAYETGKRVPGVDQLQNLLKAVGSPVQLKVGCRRQRSRRDL